MKSRCSVIALLLAALTPLALFADQPGSAVSIDSPELEVGFDGFYRLGSWTPIRHTGPGETPMSVVAPDDEGTPCRFTWPAKPVDASETRCVRIGRPAIKAGKPVLNSQQFVVVLGDTIDLSPATRLLQRNPGEEVVATNVTSEQFPSHWYAWDGVDLLVIPTSDPAAINALTGSQWQAVTTWLRMGGRLLLSVGANAEQFMSADHPLAKFAPGKLRQVIQQRETSGLETFAAPSRQAATKRISSGLTGLAIDKQEGLTLCADGRGRSQVDWVINRAFGLGVVTFVSTDLGVPPLSEWDGYDRLVAKLLMSALHGRHDDDVDRTSQSVTHFGFNDLSGQLRAALEQFPGVRLIPFGLIGLIAVAFALVVGPLDYFLLGRHLALAHWTWLTLLAAVVFTACLVGGVASSWKGREVRANSVTLVDFDAASGTVRGTTWTNLFVPTPTKVSIANATDVKLADTATVRDSLVGWHGLAGSSFGGMNSPIPVGESMSIQMPAYGISWGAISAGDEAQLDGMLIPQWSSRRFAALRRGEVDDLSDGTDLSVAPRTGLLTGTLTNPLNIALRSAYVCYDRWRFNLGDLAAGETVLLDQSVDPIDLKSKLTDRRIIDSRQIASPWNEESFDVPRIMDMIMFHDAAGGRGYTTLLHRQAGWLDLSDQLELNRAVLVGRVTDRDSPLEIIAGDAEPEMQRWTICRVVFTVKPEDKAP